MELTLENIEEKPHKLLSDYIRSEKTRKNYMIFLKIFLNVIPASIFVDNLKEKPAKEFNDQIDQFSRLAKSDIKITKQIIHAFVRELKEKVTKKELKPGTIQNYLKPIKALFAANEVDFSWKLINKSLPITGKAGDRAYTREEIQIMIEKSTDIVDKVIILLFSSAGFRLEAWDYLTWNDVKFFYTKEKELKGMALRIYAGDAEEYWTHATPEAQKIVLLYRESWKSRLGEYPKPDDPLVIATKVSVPTRLRMEGVRTRVLRLLRSSGIRPVFTDNRKRHEVPADHGFRKYFNTMMRRAKVDFLDKEDMMGHKVGLESSYERYTEEDFERFPEYQKAIPFLTISDEERATHESQMKSIEISELEKEKEEGMQKDDRISKIEQMLVDMLEKNLLDATPENKRMIVEFMENHKNNIS